MPGPLRFRPPSSRPPRVEPVRTTRKGANSVSGRVGIHFVVDLALAHPDPGGRQAAVGPLLGQLPGRRRTSRAPSGSEPAAPPVRRPAGQLLQRSRLGPDQPDPAHTRRPGWYRRFCARDDRHRAGAEDIRRALEQVLTRPSYAAVAARLADRMTEHKVGPRRVPGSCPRGRSTARLKAPRTFPDRAGFVSPASPRAPDKTAPDCLALGGHEGMTVEAMDDVARGNWLLVAKRRVRQQMSCPSDGLARSRVHHRHRWRPDTCHAAPSLTGARRTRRG